jgi:hypothetical protein
LSSFEQDSPWIHPDDQGSKAHSHAEHGSSLGSPIRFQVWPRQGLLGPAWAAVCGALASGGLTLAIEPLLRLALLVFLVDVVWGGLWSALAATDWATPLGRWQNWHHGPPTNVVPYATPDGPAAHLAHTWSHLRSWWTDLLRPTLGPTLAGLALSLPLALVIAAVLGARPLLLTLAAITLLQFVFARSGGDARPVPAPQACFEIALPWLAGHVLFASPTAPSTLLALGYAFAYAGGLRMSQNQTGLARWNLGQVVGLIVLVAWRQPLAAGIAGLLSLGQAASQPELFDAKTGEVESTATDRFLRFAQPWLMAAMLVAAWGLQAAGAGG